MCIEFGDDLREVDPYEGYEEGGFRISRYDFNGPLDADYTGKFYISKDGPGLMYLRKDGSVQMGTGGASLGYFDTEKDAKETLNNYLSDNAELDVYDGPIGC